MPPEEGDESYQRPPDFDLDGAFDQDDLDINAIAAEMGWEDWRDIIANVDELDGFNIRPGHYPYPQDAIREAYYLGILEYVTLYYDGEDWYIVVDDDNISA